MLVFIFTVSSVTSSTATSNFRYLQPPYSPPRNSSMGVSPVSSKVNTCERNSFSFPAVALPGVAIVEMSDPYSKNTLSTLTPWKNRSHKCQEKSNKTDGQEELQMCLMYQTHWGHYFTVCYQANFSLYGLKSVWAQSRALVTRWVCAPKQIFTCPVNMWWLIALLVSVCLPGQLSGSSCELIAYSAWWHVFVLCVCMHGSEGYDLSILNIWAVSLFTKTETTWHLQSCNHL